MYKVVVTENKNRQWFWHLFRNGKILAHSEAYANLRNCQKTAMHLTESFKKGMCEYIKKVRIEGSIHAGRQYKDYAAKV